MKKILVLLMMMVVAHSAFAEEKPQLPFSVQSVSDKVNLLYYIQRKTHFDVGIGYAQVGSDGKWSETNDYVKHTKLHFDGFTLTIPDRAAFTFDRTDNENTAIINVMAGTVIVDQETTQNLGFIVDKFIVTVSDNASVAISSCKVGNDCMFNGRIGAQLEVFKGTAEYYQLDKQENAGVIKAGTLRTLIPKRK